MLFIDCCPKKCNIDCMPAIEHDNETAEMTEKVYVNREGKGGERERELENSNSKSLVLKIVALGPCGPI